MVEHTFIPGPTAELPARISTPAGADAGTPAPRARTPMIHGFYWMQGVCDGAKRLHADLAEAIREVLQPAKLSA